MRISVNDSSKTKLLRGLAVISIAAGVIALSMVALIAIGRGEFDITPTLKLTNPRDRLHIGLVLLAAGYLLGVAARRPRASLKAAFGRVAICAVSLGVSILLCEWSFRVYLRRTQGFNNSLQQLSENPRDNELILKDFHPLSAICRLSPDKKLVYELNPNLRRDFGRCGDIQINRLGMRDDQEYPDLPGPDTIRIIGIGDSGMFGWDVPQGTCYLDQLETNLNRRAGTRYEVMNMSVPGYNTLQELELLKYRGVALKPHIVIVGWCENDLDIPFILYRHKDYNDWKESYVFMFLFEPEKFRSKIQPEARLYTDIDKDLIDPSVYEGIGMEGGRRMFTELKELGRRNGFKVLVFGPMQDEMTNLFAEVGLDYYDTYRKIPDGMYPAEYNVHFIHPPVAGHQVLAKHLEQALEERGWLKADSSGANKNQEQKP